jgi:hypothetical protein
MNSTRSSMGVGGRRRGCWLACAFVACCAWARPAAAGTSTCPWDLTGDGDVGILDFVGVLAAWGTNPGGPPDFDGNGIVGILDFLQLLFHWGRCPFAQCGPGVGNCCAEHGTPGCEQADCCEVVCAADPTCCTVAWDASCAAAAAQQPACGCAGPTCGPAQGNCCVSHPTPGCNDPSCCGAVCSIDPFCCDTAWDSVCVGEAEQSPACECVKDVCGPGNGSCCIAHPTPGCSDSVCCDAVCSIDPFCCDGAWDSVCVQEAQQICICP